LKWAAARGEWRFGIGDLGDMAETGVLQVFHQWWQETRSRFALGLRCIAAHSQPGFDEWANQPRPHCALVIGAFALAPAALVTSDIASLPFSTSAAVR
jgi:hypothetical protein